MLVINHPEVVENGDDAILRASFSCRNVEGTLWFSTTLANKYYLCYERGDAFLVGLLLYAMKRGEDITVRAPVSERLYYTLTTYYIKFLADLFPGYKKIRLICETDAGNLANLGAVGTGFSCGIDSFCTVIYHTANECPPNFRLTHLTFFNVGAAGDNGGEGARERFKNRIKGVKPCADAYGLPLITLDSNISEILQMEYVRVHTIRNVAAVLALQKLFNVYFYSSGYPVKQFEASPYDSAHYDIFGLDMLSTSDVTFFSSGSTYSRVEKTEIITTEPLTRSYLNVCLTSSDTNCAKCDKCLRTLVTLEVLGKLSDYSGVFDLATYKKYRHKYIAGVLVEKHDFFKMDIHDAMRRYHYPVPFAVYLQVPQKWCYETCRHMAIFIYRKFINPLKNRSP